MLHISGMKRSRSYCRPFNIDTVLYIPIMKYLGHVSQPLYLTSFFQPLSRNQLYPNLGISILCIQTPFPNPFSATPIAAPLCPHPCILSPIYLIPMYVVCIENKICMEPLFFAYILCHSEAIRVVETKRTS
jgi:hypothetical protein